MQEHPFGAIKWYLAGPMSGIPQYNFPLFEYAARVLRFANIEVVSPAELDRETNPELYKSAVLSFDGHGLPGCENPPTWGDLLSRDVKVVADTVGGLILLPGWAQSRDARLEAFVALNCTTVCEADNAEVPYRFAQFHVVSKGWRLIEKTPTEIWQEIAQHAKR